MSITIPIETAPIFIKDAVFQEMIHFGEEGYPEEAAGFLLGSTQADCVTICRFLPVANHAEAEIRFRSYHISSSDWLKGETEAIRLEMEIIGVFHTHPDHVSIPSRYDLEFALPNFIYVIAAIHQGKLATIDAWKLHEDRSQFDQAVLMTKEM